MIQAVCGTYAAADENVHCMQLVTFTDGIANTTGDTHLSASLPHLADEGLK